jgi:hypothetical protein
MKVLLAVSFVVAVVTGIVGTLYIEAGRDEYGAPLVVVFLAALVGIIGPVLKSRRRYVRKPPAPELVPPHGSCGQADGGSAKISLTQDSNALSFRLVKGDDDESRSSCDVSCTGSIRYAGHSCWMQIRLPPMAIPAPRVNRDSGQWFGLSRG